MCFYSPPTNTPSDAVQPLARGARPDCLAASGRWGCSQSLRREAGAVSPMLPASDGLPSPTTPHFYFISLLCIHFTLQHQDLDVPCSGHTFLGQCKSSRVFVLFNFILYPRAPPPLRHRVKLCLSSLFRVSVCKVCCCVCVCAHLCLCGSVASFFTRDSVKT